MYLIDIIYKVIVIVFQNAPRTVGVCRFVKFP